jgi:hypothetical protein
VMKPWKKRRNLPRNITRLWNKWGWNIFFFQKWPLGAMLLYFN